MSTAESLTGGRLAARLAAVPGASAGFRGGVVAYASDIKVSLLGVSTAVVERHGVVSAECALAMARGVRHLTGSTYAVSTTGVAGPSRQEDRPVGTVFVGLCGPSSASSVELGLSGSREEIIEQSVLAALESLRDLVAEDLR